MSSFSDNFTSGSNGDLISARTGWTVGNAANVNTNATRNASGQMQCGTSIAGASHVYIYPTSSASTNDHVSAMTGVTAGNSNHRFCGVRMTSVNNTPTMATGYCLGFASSTWTVYRQNGNTFTSITTLSGSFTDRISLWASGSTITVRNHTAQTSSSVTDANYSSGVCVAVIPRGTTSNSTIDNVDLGDINAGYSITQNVKELTLSRGSVTLSYTDAQQYSLSVSAKALTLTKPTQTLTYVDALSFTADFTGAADTKLRSVSGWVGISPDPGSTKGLLLNGSGALKTVGVSSPDAVYSTTDPGSNEVIAFATVNSGSTAVGTWIAVALATDGNTGLGLRTTNGTNFVLSTWTSLGGVRTNISDTGGGFTLPVKAGLRYKPSTGDWWVYKNDVVIASGTLDSATRLALTGTKVGLIADNAIGGINPSISSWAFGYYSATTDYSLGVVGISKTLSPKTVTLKRGGVVLAGAKALTLTAIDVSLKAAFVIQQSVAALTLSPQSVTLTVSGGLQVLTRHLTLTPRAVQLRYFTSRIWTPVTDGDGIWTPVTLSGATWSEV